MGDVSHAERQLLGPTHATCERDKRARGEDPDHCVFGPVRWPYVASSEVPVLVQISGQDTTQLPAFGVVDDNDRRRWQDAVRTSLDSVPWVFSGAGVVSVASHNERFNKGAERNGSFQSLVLSFGRRVAASDSVCLPVACLQGAFRERRR